MMKTTTVSKALIIRINLVFLAAGFFIIYVALFLQPSSSVYFENNAAASLVRCSLWKKIIKMEAILEETNNNNNNNKPIKPGGKVNVTTKIEVPSFMNQMGKGMKIGMVNMDEFDVSEWRVHGETIPVSFEPVSEYLKWQDLFPEWIDEEEEADVPSCPEIPMPDFGIYDDKMDMVVAKLPCNNKYYREEEGWGRDVFRLQVHLIVANLAVKQKEGNNNKKKRNWNNNWRTKVVFWSKCRPMLELFRCEDLVRREGEYWWYYEPDIARLEQKVSLPVGSCKLALPLWGQDVDVYDLSKIKKSTTTTTTRTAKREAYATVLHSKEAYVCGAITLAQSLLKTGTKRDLVLLIDNSISMPKREALSAAGWKIRIIQRIRNPKSQKNTYNEYNYSKFRLWQLTDDYDKIIFIDADIIVLRNLDLLFHFPQMSATGNARWIFNSGIMVIEPSNCTFRLLMNQRKEIVSYNGGDQGFLNEVYVWWHRLPRRVNFLKNFWANTTLEASIKNHLFGADPPKLYAIHYLGVKPWACYRDYDCNWDVEQQHVYATDVAHKRWWMLHDSMDEKLQKFCGLTKRRRIELDWNRKKARELGLPNGHWSINITDPRRSMSRLID